ncbi:MAG TPA: hypothetical protein V6D26_23885 [Stenomitos sp.]
MADSTNYNSQQLFGRCIKTLAAILGEDFGDTAEHERWKEQAIMTPLLDEMSNGLEPMPDIYCDWFDIPRGWTYADFADHIRETDARILTTHVGVVYGYLTTIAEYYGTGSQEDRKMVEEIVAHTASIHGACTDGSDLMLLTPPDIGKL